MKKLLSFMLSLAVLSGTGTITTLAADVITETFGNNTIEVSNNGKCVKVYSTDNDIEIEYRYSNMWIDGKVIKPDTTYTLTDEDWERLKNLDDTTDIDPVEYMYFSDNVTEIDYQFIPGFYSQLKLIDFGSSLEKIGDYAFEYSATDRIYFPDSLKEIGAGAFENCDNLYTVAIPENVETIGDYAFMDCNSLNNIVILSRNAVFGEKCMGYLYPDEDDLKSDITIRGYAGSTAETYALENGLNFIALPEDSTFEAEISDDLKNIRIYDIISDIEYTLSDGILTIDGKIIDTNVRFNNDSFLTEQDKEIFIEFLFMIRDEATEIVYTDNVTEIYDDIPVFNIENIVKITFGRNVSEISNGIFDFLNPQTEIYGYSGTDTERIARQNYLNFFEMTADGDVDKIAYFSNMRNIANYEISEDKKTLSWEYPDYVNNHKHQIKDGVYIIDGTVIEDEQPVDIDELTDEEVEKLICDIKVVHEWVENNPIEEVIFSDNVTEIHTYNRNNFINSAKKLTFGENVEIIGDHVFNPYGDSQITEIVFGNKLKKIEKGAFVGQDMITEITIPESVEEIEMQAFFACDSLSDITILSRNVVLGDECFGYVYGFPDADRADVTIHGYKGSTAEAYANENGFTFTALDEPDILYGDANCDGRVTIADATAIIQALGNPDEYALSGQGEKNADCFNTGDGVTGKDAVVIQLIEAGLLELSSLPANDIVPPEI